MAIFAAEQLHAFHLRLLELDPQFFEVMENVAVYRDFAGLLPYYYTGLQQRSDSLLQNLPPFNRIPS